MAETWTKRAALSLVAVLLISVLTVLTAAAEPAMAAPATIRVPQDQPTIRDAIDAAAPGDTVLVAPGTYAETVDLGSKDITLRSSGGPDVTTIQGVGGSVVVTGTGGVVQGFTITGGTEPNGWALIPGDGTVIRGNRIVRNQAPSGRGEAAVHIDGTSPVIDGNLFEENTCEEPNGGSVHGVLGVDGPSSARITNNVFADNVCGADIDIDAGISSSPIVVANNTMTRGQIGIYVEIRTGPLVIRNNLVTDNEVGYRFDFQSTLPTFDHNFIGGNRKNVADGTTNLLGADGNLTGNPGLIDPSSDYEPRAGSPLIDHGSSTNAPTVDFNGDPRPAGAVDIGAFERDGTEPLPPTTGQLDPTWSGDGMRPVSSRYQMALGPLASGRLYTATWRDVDNGPMFLTRYNADGSVDGRFGSGGVQKRTFTPDGKGFGFAYQLLPDRSRLVVVGEAITSGNRDRLGVDRLITSGAYDPTFSGDGKVLYRIFPHEHTQLVPLKVTVLPDGRITGMVDAYDLVNGKGYEFVEQALFRLRADGSLDPTFYGSGIKVVPNDWFDVSFMPDGSFYASRKDGNDHIVMRRRSSGAIDTTFSGDGQTSVDCGSHRGVALKADTAGRAVLVCVLKLETKSASNYNEYFRIIWKMFRFTRSGALDPTYSDDGKNVFIIDDWFGGSSDYEIPWLTRLDAQGRLWIITAGSPFYVAGGRMLAIYRFGTDGELDPGWSGDGIQRTLLPFPVNFNMFAFGTDRIYTALQETDTKVEILAHVTT
jgi:uncharacterized delta-60 repeat protein